MPIECYYNVMVCVIPLRRKSVTYTGLSQWPLRLLQFLRHGQPIGLPFSIVLQGCLHQLVTCLSHPEQSALASFNFKRDWPCAYQQYLRTCTCRASLLVILSLSTLLPVCMPFCLNGNSFALCGCTFNLSPLIESQKKNKLNHHPLII